MTEQAKILSGIKVRYDWYQTETLVTLNVLHRNIDASKLKVECQPRKVSIWLPDIEEPFEVYLVHDIRPDGISHKVSAAKLELQLPKEDGIHWGKLEGEETVGKPFPKAQSSSVDTPVCRTKNWDAVVKDEEIEEEDPLNTLFKKIYSEGSDEVRKAMNKSFMESGGTVLSTNWKEVQAEKVDVKPPDGMEYKKWD